jgi:hypothetical protein
MLHLLKHLTKSLGLSSSTLHKSASSLSKIPQVATVPWFSAGSIHKHTKVFLTKVAPKGFKIKQ